MGITQALAQKQLQKRSVKVGEERRYNNLSAWPFWYNFVAYPYQQGAINEATGFYTNTVANAEGPDGISVAANGGIIDIPIILHRDMAFHMLYIKIGAWNTEANDIETGAVAYTGSRERLVEPRTAFQSGRTEFMAQNNQRVPYWTQLDMSVYFSSSGGRDLYGGMQHVQNYTTSPTATAQVAQNARIEFPMPVMNIQGTEDGMGMIRTAYQLPPQAQIMVKVTNRYESALRVYGCIYGYKVKV